MDESNYLTYEIGTDLLIFTKRDVRAIFCFELDDVSDFLSPLREEEPRNPDESDPTVEFS